MSPIYCKKLDVHTSCRRLVRQSLGRQIVGHLPPTKTALKSSACEVFGGCWHHEKARFQLPKVGALQVGAMIGSKKIQ